MYYALICEDVENSLPLRKKVRAEHLERLQALRDEGRLLTAGPLPAIPAENPGDAGYAGSLVIAEFESEQAAKDWASEDPYTTEGVFQSVTIKPYKQVF
ncbi:MAG: YciI family protein [Cellvibrionales bacterium]|nr:YciI family protein [Cellvibrionales bacterium]